jgi:AraC family transcriptional regulator, regulatory protein of adaptative response / DNA-3-methyladenine glycosylase II
LTDLRDLTTAVQRLRRLFDLDSDPYAVDARLSADPRLAPLVARRPGLRSPGAAEPEEFAVRALAGRVKSEWLVERYGTPLDQPSGGLTHLFPAPAELLADEPALGAVADIRLDPGADRDATEQALLALPGMTPLAAGLIRMRALGDPDVAPLGEPGTDGWRPWRSYGMRHLWLDRPTGP